MIVTHLHHQAICTTVNELDETKIVTYGLKITGQNINTPSSSLTGSARVN